MTLGEELGLAATRGVHAGLSGVLLVDANGDVLARSGALPNRDAGALVAFVLGLSGEARARELFGGAVLEVEVDGQPLCVAVACRAVFVIAMAPSSEATNAAVRARAVCADVELALEPYVDRVPGAVLTGGRGGGGGGPAQLPAFAPRPSRRVKPS